MHMRLPATSHALVRACLGFVVGLITRLWAPPRDLPGSLESEWRLVAVRWSGIVLMAPALQLLNLETHRLVAAYGVLGGAAVYNLFVQAALWRRPGLLTSGYLTTLGDGLLNVAMISLGGGFDTPFYFLLYTVTIAAAMRYGYGPTAAGSAIFVVCDLLELRLAGKAPDGPFLLRSGFLALTGILASNLREQAWRAQSALHDQLRQAEHEALHDRLTGLPNRSLLLNRIQQAIATASETGRGLALLVVDLDRFKEVNDTLGHHYGDMLLPQVGARFVQALPSQSTVARLGGDEFAVLLPTSDVMAATGAALELERALQPRFTVDQHDLDVGASIGIAVYPAHGEDATSLLRHADVAMYVAKRSGDGYAVYTAELDQHSPQRLALLGELRQAIERDDLVLHYQPKVALDTGRLVGVEALVRWRRADGVLVAPDQFIPLAEQTGLIRPLTRRVLDQALRQTWAWRQAGLELTVAVNLSMRDLHDPELPAALEHMLRKWEATPDCLLLEITESCLMSEPTRALETAVRLASTGVRLAIDDFGTGYSSLAYLKRLPVAELKIDKSFVGTMARDEGDATIVRSTIGLAHDLGLSVVAEGVEDQATWDLLGLLGCDVAQGYYLSQPTPASEFVQWLGPRSPQNRWLPAAA